MRKSVAGTIEKAKGAESYTPTTPRTDADVTSSIPVGTHQTLATSQVHAHGKIRTRE